MIFTKTIAILRRENYPVKKTGKKHRCDKLHMLMFPPSKNIAHQRLDNKYIQHNLTNIVVFVTEITFQATSQLLGYQLSQSTQMFYQISVQTITGI
jgi:hypothetical protein